MDVLIVVVIVLILSFYYYRTSVVSVKQTLEFFIFFNNVTPRG